MKKFYRYALILLCPWLLLLSAPSGAEDLEGLFDIPVSDDAKPYSQDSPFSGSCSLSGMEIYCKITIRGDAYLYKDDIKLESAGKSYSLHFFEKAAPHEDPLGKRDVFFHGVSFKAAYGNEDVVTLSFQGCDQNGVCYPPSRQEFNFRGHGANDQASPIKSGGGSTLLQDAYKENRIFSSGDSGIMQLALALLLGVGLNLTPCVLPMLAVFSAMITGVKSSGLSKILLSNACYLLGLALAYTLAGLFFAKIGVYAHAFLQHPAIIALTSLLLLLFALNCAGVFELRIPASYSALIQKKIAAKTGGGLKSAFLLGALSALIATPCTGAPLAGAILYVMQSNDLLFGAALFLCIGLGLGLPLFAVGIFGGRLLQKVGKWSVLVKKLMALPLLAAAFYIGSSLMGSYEDEGLALLCAVCASYALFVFLSVKSAVSVLAKTLGCALTFAIVLGSVRLYSSSLKQETPAVFTVLSKEGDLDRFKGKPVILTFSAKWCANCHELDRTLYASAEFLKLKDDFSLLRFDLTDASSQESREVAQRFGIVGVPTVVILDGDGKTLGGFTGILDFEKLKELAQKAQAPN